jgi:hypothetical protein
LRVERSLQSAGRPIVGEEMSTGVAPALRSNHPWPAPRVDRLDDVERRENASLDADVRRRNPDQSDELAALVRADIEHTPSSATHADVLRNLHCGSAARAQKLPREKSRGSRINDLRPASGAEASLRASDVPRVSIPWVTRGRIRYPTPAYVSERSARRAIVAPRWEAGSSWNSTTAGWRSSAA